MRQPKPWRTRVETPARTGPDVADYFRWHLTTGRRLPDGSDRPRPTYRDYEEWAHARAEPNEVEA